jgi:hypothetical protein
MNRKNNELVSKVDLEFGNKAGKNCGTTAEKRYLWYSDEIWQSKSKMRYSISTQQQKTRCALNATTMESWRPGCRLGPKIQRTTKNGWEARDQKAILRLLIIDRIQGH